MDEALLKKAQDRVDYEAAHDPNVKQIIRIVEDFLKSTQVLCYGGTAINNLLPPKDRFYDPEYDIPDYDFYSKEPQLHALRLADKYSKAGFKSVEVKPGGASHDLQGLCQLHGSRRHNLFGPKDL